MKYLITESKMNETIKKVILDEFPVVSEVRFTKLKVTLGSSQGTPTVDRTVIWVILNNSQNQYDRRQLLEIRDDIRSKVDGIFGLGINDYGSEWEIEFRQVAIVSLDATLSRIR